ncbi:MAG: ankyrin repeat domain-containing protein [Alphaproteobacteria bacterium]|nr:ankyrin repeat domain-containing protein [Alphaproteobacteria bacterium]
MKKLFAVILSFGIIFVTFPTSAQLSLGREVGSSSLPSSGKVKPDFPSWPQWWRDATPEKVKELLDQGADATGKEAKNCGTVCGSTGCHNNTTCPYDNTPIMLAAKYSKYPEIIDLLVEKGANVEDKNILEETPLILAALFSAYPEIIKALLKQKANPLVKNIYGKNALFYATSNPSIYNTVAYWSLKSKTQ